MRFAGPAVCDCDDRPGELEEFLERLEEYAPGPFVPSMLRESQTEKLKQHARLTMEYCAIGNIPCRQSTPKGSLTLAHCRSMCEICLPRRSVGVCLSRTDCRSYSHPRGSTRLKSDIFGQRMRMRRGGRYSEHYQTRRLRLWMREVGFWGAICVCKLAKSERKWASDNYEDGRKISWRRTWKSGGWTCPESARQIW